MSPEQTWNKYVQYSMHRDGVYTFSYMIQWLNDHILGYKPW
jgi:hypothetical protein